MNFPALNPLLPLAAFSALLTVATPASARHILSDADLRQYAARYQDNPAVAAGMEIPASATPEEAEAMKFLYAYMATPDIIDNDADFFLENVRLALQAADEMPWGDKVPDREWKHFVLPVRVNNENLDMSRKVFFDELKERVKRLTMEEAILEVNHWCHEKVSYQPSDPRTSSPLATVGNALGRCGEESTFTVAALRSVGIPARQVYTPRWAHTDDNHAWVEAWADGKWHFIGACEPEPVLDLAWFNAPAARGMLMTTNVTGRYDGPEEVISVNPVATVINVTGNYAPVRQSTVCVTDSVGMPLEHAEVRFSLYNYAEFFPLAVKRTDAEGQATFTSGDGDMMIWATDGSRFNLTPIHAGDSIRIALTKDRSFTGTMDFDLVPPPTGGDLPFVTEAARVANDRRKEREDSIRLAYVGTFLSPSRAEEISAELGLPPEAVAILVKSRGNHKTITGFLESIPQDSRRRAVDLLGAMAEKDLHDVTPDVLADHLNHTRGNESSPLFIPYVLNPRIEFEMLRPYKEMIMSHLSPERIIRYTSSPDNLAADLKEALRDDTFNPYRYRQAATSTLGVNTADDLNRSIAFVAVCRSLGVPARIDPISGATQYADTSDVWHDVDLSTESGSNPPATGKSVLEIRNMNPDFGREPKYYSQFSLSRIEEGKPYLMEFDDFEPLTAINARQQQLSEGQYMLVSGQRLADGSVLARAEFFRATPGETASPGLVVRQDTTALQVIGSLDAELLYTPVDLTGDRPSENPKRSILATTGRGYYVLGLVAPGHEPSAHALNDISAAADELAATGRKLLLLFPDADAAARFRPGDYGALPENVCFGIDTDGIAEALTEGLELPDPAISDLPVFVVADSFNRIIFARRGYGIHLGETLARILRQTAS